MNVKQLRTLFLALIFTSTLFILKKVLMAPAVSEDTITSFDLSTEVPLSEWQFLASNPPEKPIKVTENSQKIAQRHYQYRQNNVNLDIEMRYFINTEADVEEYIRKNASITASPVVRHQDDIGFYGLFADDQKAYLSACINSRGGSTFTTTQFIQNRFIHDSSPERLFPWLLGQKSLHDNRCLWTLMATPLQDSSPEAAYQILETAWADWHNWWQSNFPES